MKKLIILFIFLILISSFILTSCSSKLVFYDKDNDVRVYGDFFENGTEFSFEYFPYESHAMEEIMESLKLVGIKLGDKGDFNIYNIETTLYGISVDPSDYVEVRIPKPSNIQDINEFDLYRVNNDEIEKIEYTQKGKYLCFKTNKFSFFVFNRKNVKDPFYIAVYAEGPGKVINEKKEEVNFVNMELGDSIKFYAQADKGHIFKGWYYSYDLNNPISLDEVFSYTRDNLNDEGFFIYAVFE